jgi:signal transduction histidine kinase
MRWRIRFQLLVPLLILLLGDLAVSAYVALASAARARQAIDARLRDVAHFVAEAPWLTLNDYVLRYMKQLSGADYYVLDDGLPPLTTLDERPERPPPAETVGDDWRTLQLGPPVVVGNQRYLCSGVRLPARPGAILYVLYPEKLLRDALWEAVWPTLVLGGAFGVASVALAVGLGGRLTRRLRELERRTRQIAAGDFSPMPLPRGEDEVRDLARSVNEMAQRLAQFQETVRRSERLRLLGQVSGGLAHQLRNGLTGARLALQLYAKESAGQTDTTALDVALRQLTLLEANLKRFLDLGRHDQTRRSPCPLTPLVSEAVELLRPRCRHAGIELHWVPPAEPFILDGDGAQLSQMILNLLGNAVEAAGTGGNVSIRMGNGEWGMEDGATDYRPTEEMGPSVPHSPLLIPHSFPTPHSHFPIVIEVLDSGPGPPEAIRERLFEPFVTGKAEGVGLGLAVARQVAEAHGGHIRWGRVDGRTSFRVEFPKGQPREEAHPDR